MKIPFQYPDPSGTERAGEAKKFRDLATEISRLRPHAVSRANGDETNERPDSDNDERNTYPANFTKGMLHDQSTGLLANANDYHCLVEAINSPDRNIFDKRLQGANDHVPPATLFHCTIDTKKPDWRGWESPRAGHVYELQGADPGAVAMAPAPALGSSELAAEMAEVYCLALLRDVPFTVMATGGDTKIDANGASTLSAQAAVDALNSMSYFNGIDRKSSTPSQADASGLNSFERNRRRARTGGDLNGLLTLGNVFRGSAYGADTGPMISQFMLAGAPSRYKGNGGIPSYPALNTIFEPEDGFLQFGSQVIDQRVHSHRVGLDYMTDWASWLDVQNGANVSGSDQFIEKRRYITTPRDLATYVHYDALYQAYLNAALLLLTLGTETQRGFPEPSMRGQRTGFATFGGPHILSLLTEVATRCLKAVRRQKFNYHRRCRPEAIGARLTAVGGSPDPLPGLAGNYADAFAAMLDDMPDVIKEAVIAHNANQNTNPDPESAATKRAVKCATPLFPHGINNMTEFDAANLLLPMAFPEGSPMHPAYGAGHATVAGGCITMIKAFFNLYDPAGPDGYKILKIGDNSFFEPSVDGSRLVNTDGPALTIQGELNKLAANISIGRNMAGVHFYSDYYDSLRMGERVALSVLQEQAPTYGDEMEIVLDTFDGDRLTLTGEAGTCPITTVIDAAGNAANPQQWWLRHVSGEDVILDL